MGFFKKIFGSYSDKELKKNKLQVDAVLALEDSYRAMSESELKAQTDILKNRLKNNETLDDILPEAFATCREAADRVLNMRHFPVQVEGGVILHQGRIAEMKTGEGKTLVATLPAYLNALTGAGVHIVTVNDYLAKRDSEWMGKVYRYLGLSVGLVVNDMDKSQRKESYNADITYGTNNEFGFDYLRDNMVTYMDDKVQRSHIYSIVDEVDSILIDEARTPLIISGRGDESTDLYQRADSFAATLTSIRVVEVDSKEDTDAIYDEDYIIDEKAKTATLTPSGTKKAEKHFNVESITDLEHSTLLHHINQAIKARGTMKRDIDYVVSEDGQILIVDEFTGRLMHGRRYNKGLHQAIEAKEGVEVKRESKTLATITFQNYFRLYKKLAGMTGTALTEEDEFREIYNLDCIEIPTNMPLIRKDNQDVVFKSKKGKNDAIVGQILDCYEKKQPILVGTVSIEDSEGLSGILKRSGVKHQVLNAKRHRQEAEIVAQAGKVGAVTIATNMAGRGTDIVLGGNAEHMATTEMVKLGFSEDLIVEATGFGETADAEVTKARQTFTELHEKFKKEVKPEAEEVLRLGGLYILGTERHESRRIDNQLRGRAGRQGDPGETTFVLSLEDDLLRLFNADRVQSLMDTLGVDENMPLETKLLSNTIESAQARVEGQNFAIRKNVLRYDDVMNRQREIIYGQRNMVLENKDLKETVITMIDQTVDEKVAFYLSSATEDNSDWNMAGLREYYKRWIIREDELNYTEEELNNVNPKDIVTFIKDRSNAIYQKKEEEYGEEIMRELERVILLNNVDSNWMDHIDAMDELKQGISLRSYGQQDPVVAYRLEGFDMFDEMIAVIREDTVKKLMTVVITSNEEPKRRQVAVPLATGPLDGRVSITTRRIDPKQKVGRNDPCYCGSGKKFKHCHGR